MAHQRFCDLGDDKGEMTWVARDYDPRWIGLDDSNDGSSPSNGSDMESH
jgi:hypothetical protein